MLSAGRSKADRHGIPGRDPATADGAPLDTDRPVPGDVVDRILQNGLRAPSAGFSQGWAFLVLDDPADVARFRGRGPACGRPGRILRGAGRGPAADRAAVTQRRLPRPLRPAGQGAHGSQRRLVARPLLGYRHRVRCPADAADRRRCRARRVLLRAPGRPDRGLPRRIRRAAQFTPIGAISIGYSDEPPRDLRDRAGLPRRSCTGASGASSSPPAERSGRWPDGPSRPAAPAGHGVIGASARSAR